MKSLKSKLLLIGLSATMASTAFAAGDEHKGSCSITWQERKEMFLLGTFHVREADGTERGAFAVNYLPGASHVVTDASKHWVHAAEALKPFLEGETFWKNEIWGSFTGGLQWGWDSNAACGTGAISSDFDYFWKDFNSVTVTEFGGIGHKALDCLGAVASLVCRPIIGAGAIVAGAAAAIAVPPLKVAGIAGYSFAQASIGAVALPMLKMTWNGAAWTATQIYTETPPEADSLIVTWHPTQASHCLRDET